MKTKIISLITVLSLILNPLQTLGVEISFEVLDEEYLNEEQDTQIQYEESFVIEDANNTGIILPSEAMATYTNDDLNDEVVLEHNVSTMSINKLNMPVVTNYMVFSRTNSTFIDVTELATGEMVSHNCELYLAKNFNETEHWNECTVCRNRFDETEHEFSSYWLLGDSCHSDNKLHHTCNCGYFYETANTRSHAKTASWCNDFYCTFACSVCHELTAYYGTAHYNNSNQMLGCVTGISGICKNCGIYWKPRHYNNCMYYEKTGFDEDFCLGCGISLFDPELSSIEIIKNGNNFTINARIYCITAPTSVSPFVSQFPTETVIASSSTSINGNYGIVTATGYFYDGLENEELPVSTSFTCGSSIMFATTVQLCPDTEAPVITELQENDLNLKDGWITGKELTIKGTENYCKSVKLSMTDEEGNIYLNETSVNVNDDKTWEYTFVPEIESNENTKFIITVKDGLNNVTIKDDIIYSHLDKKAPIVMTENNSTSKEWSKTKEYMISCIDKGIGGVSFAFNDLEELYPADVEGDNFYKNFIFTGDVYGKIIGAVYYQDALGNVSTSFVDIYNLDNTSPTIENVSLNKSLHNTEITILANDMNEKLNATGSGVTGYAISTENEIPDTFQESSTFNLTESGTYYLFVTDLVGNISSKEIYIPVQYKVTIDPDGGTWKGSTEPQEFETDEPINLYPEPEKEGYTFKEWEIEGDAEINEDGDLVVEGDVQVTPIWEANTYPVIYIDYNMTNKEEMNRIIKEVNYNIPVRGFDIGSDTTDNAYYKQYRLISDTSVIVSTNPENNVVYRYFEFCYTSKESHINFNDNNNENGLRPEKYKLQLILEDGTLIDEVTLPTIQPDYVFENLPKYDERGEEYNYKVIPIISDRYDITPNPEDESTPEISYSSPECKILIPKVTTLDGKDGNLTYTIQVEANLFYEDKIIIVPDTSVILTDGVKNMAATITQDKTEFNKEDNLQITGKIQTTKKHFAGTWTGNFNFKIKYEVKN